MSSTSELPWKGGDDDDDDEVGELSRLNMRECFLRIDESVDDRRIVEDEASVEDEGVKELLSLRFESWEWRSDDSRDMLSRNVQRRRSVDRKKLGASEGFISSGRTDRAGRGNAGASMPFIS
ncbi:hypothetical protein PIIN_03581 [Serendipita indica DSM 11827]|uniref:Uncharacterized protein n=1 Tax=Serendipita indica (strain DSM 11827) TaxID=1109443 RepID=G4TE83_SERID|nr:hypothetical protein PIIN_03581 [Serendipita indica DSM 11827]